MNREYCDEPEASTWQLDLTGNTWPRNDPPSEPEPTERELAEDMGHE